MAKMDIFRECMEFKNRTGRWPRTKIIINGKKFNKKQLLQDKMKYKEYIEEFDLSTKWKKSDEYKLLISYADKEIEDTPKEYQDMIYTLREMGLGLSGKRNDIAFRCEQFYKKYGRLPGRVTKEQAINEEKRIEKRLYSYISQRGVRKILEEYVSVPLEEVPEEYCDLVKRFRAMGMGIVSQKSTNVKDYIDFVTKNKREPVYYEKPKNKEQVIEKGIRHKWRMCKVHEMYIKYGGFFIEEVPAEYQEIIQQIRDMWLKIDGENVADEVIEYVRKNKREPREFFEQFNYIDEGSVEEKILKEKWDRCFEKNVIERFVGVQIENIPNEYRDIVSKMRKAGLGLPESINTQIYIKYVLEHLKKPRQVIFKNGKKVDYKDCSEKEKEELIIRHRWDASEDRKIYIKYLEGTLDNKTKEIYSDMLYELDKTVEAVNLGVKKSAEDKLKLIQEKKNREKQAKSKKREEAKQKKLEEAKKIKEEEKAKKAKEREEEKARKAKEKEIEKAIKRADRREEMDRRKQARAAYKELEKQRLQEEKKAKEEEEKRIEEEEERKKREEMKKQFANERRLAKRAMAKMERKKIKEKEKVEMGMQVAKDYISFINDKGRSPKICFYKGGKPIKINELTDEQIEERVLRRKWDKSDFIDVIEQYVGIPIDKIPEQYQQIIAQFRDLGIGLTYDEYEEYRKNHNPKEVLISAKATQEWLLQKRARARALVKEIKAQNKDIEKEHNDE